LLSNLLVAFGGFALAYAAAILLGRKPDLIHPCLALLYIYAMQVLNRFLDRGASTYNDPERASFYRKHRIFLILSGVLSMIGALVLSFYLGTMVFFAMAGLSILGIIYSIPIVPISLRHLWRYSKIKDIPGSKTLSVALAWGVLISLLPLLEPTSLAWPRAIVSFSCVFSIVYARRPDRWCGNTSHCPGREKDPDSSQVDYLMGRTDPCLSRPHRAGRSLFIPPSPRFSLFDTLPHPLSKEVAVSRYSP
jgi:hypothetical protein